MNILVKIGRHRRGLVGAALFFVVVALLQMRNDSSLIEERVATAEADGLPGSTAETPSTFSVDAGMSGKAPVEVSRETNDGTSANPSQPAPDDLGDVEASLVANDEIDLVWFEENDKSGDLFDRLAEELRNSASIDASEQRARFEGLFLSPEQTQNGSVRLETLECRENLCAAEFSGNDDALLNEYAKAVFTSETFAVRAVFQPYREPGDLPDVYRRYIFSHNIEIDTIRTSDSKFEFHNKQSVTQEQ